MRVMTITLLSELIVAATAVAAPAARQDQIPIQGILKGGSLYDPAAIEAALGIAPRG